MRDAFLMRGVQSIQNLRCVFDRLLDRQRTFQRRALDELHHQIIRPDIVKLADVGMVQGRHRSGFLLETLGELFFRNLDRDDAIEARVAGLIHLAHSARADGSQDFVGSQFVSR